jgi:hypothetical protein
MYVPPCAVDPAKASDRTELGKYADKWEAYWEDLSRWYHARPAFQRAFSAAYFAALDAKQSDPLSTDPILKMEYESRTPQKWSAHLASRAKAFHDASEKVAASGAWASKAYVFYSTGHPTTQRISISFMGDLEWSRYDLFRDLEDGTARPAQSAGSGKNAAGEKEHWVDYEQWVVDGGRAFKRFWRLSAIRDEHGDGTVPLCSQLGFGGAINVFKPLPEKPAHVPAPNSFWLWKRVIDVLLGYDVTKHLVPAGNVDPVKGTVDENIKPEY